MRSYGKKIFLCTEIWPINKQDLGIREKVFVSFHRSIAFHIILITIKVCLACKRNIFALTKKTFPHVNTPLNKTNSVYTVYQRAKSFAISRALCAFNIVVFLILAKKYSEHINYDNKNGYGGELISTVNSIIQKLWCGKERVVSASKLKVSSRSHRIRCLRPTN